MPTIKDSQGFYCLPGCVEQLIPLLLPRLSRQKLDQLIAVLADRPPKSLAPEDLRFLTERETAIILAAIELGRITWAKPAQAGTIIDSPEASYQALLPLLRGKQTEHFVVLFLDIKNRLLDSKVLSIGSWTETLVPIPEILKLCLIKGSPRMIVAHNHPSGDTSPSPEDYKVTEQLLTACKTVGVLLLDHLVIGDHGYTSIRAKGSLENIWPH